MTNWCYNSIKVEGKLEDVVYFAMETLDWEKNFNDIAPYKLSEFESKGNNIWHFETGNAPSERFFWYLATIYHLKIFAAWFEPDTYQSGNGIFWPNGNHDIEFPELNFISEDKAEIARMQKWLKENNFWV